MKKTVNVCDFCEKRDGQFIGTKDNRVVICRSCVALCNEIFAEHDAEEARSKLATAPATPSGEVPSSVTSKNTND